MQLKLRSFSHLTLFVLLNWMSVLVAASSENQTPEVSPIFSGDQLPFQVRIELLKDDEENNFLLPNGLQSFDYGIYKGKWLLLNGRTNGLHGFNDNPDNFPPRAQNRVVYVVDPIDKTIYFRSLEDSDLTLDQIDSLSVTNAQSYQSGQTLYITGGYGFRRGIDNFTTFPFLTAIDIRGLMHWVQNPKKHRSILPYIRQISNPLFQITGGEMMQVGKNHPTLLILGQDFEGTYNFGVSSQIYSEQVRRFHIHDDGKHLSVESLDPKPIVPASYLRRRDLNVVPILSLNSKGKVVSSVVALSGVFTVEGGIWTVPVNITAKGTPSMPDPLHPTTFKQGMNNYAAPTVGLFSKRSGEMYTIIFGGLSYGFFQDGTFQTDPEIPFVNQVTTIKRDRQGQDTQYLMKAEYPVILSTQSNPGNQLLFGASAHFLPAQGLEKFQYENGVFNLDKLPKPLLLGYIVGGIQSTVPNTTSASDTAASPYIFKVILYDR